MAVMGWRIVGNVAESLLPLAVAGLAVTGLTAGMLWGMRHAAVAHQKSHERRCRRMIANWSEDPDDPVWTVFNGDK